MKLTVKMTMIETYEIDGPDDDGASPMAAAMMYGADILKKIRDGDISPDESDVGEITIIDITEDYEEEQEELELEDEPTAAELEEMLADEEALEEAELPTLTQPVAHMKQRD